MAFYIVERTSESQMCDPRHLFLRAPLCLRYGRVGSKNDSARSGHNIMKRSSIKRLVAGVAMAGAVAATALGSGGLPAHAAQGIHRCISIQCFPQPSVQVLGQYGEIYVYGTNFPVNHSIEVDYYAPVWSSLPPLTRDYVFTGTTGSFVDAFVAPSACFYGQMEVQVIDLQTNAVFTNYAVPGCIG